MGWAGCWEKKYADLVQRKILLLFDEASKEFVRVVAVECQRADIRVARKERAEVIRDGILDLRIQ